MLSAVVLRAISSPSKADVELNIVRVLYGLLTTKMGGVNAGLSSEGCKEDEGGRGGRGTTANWSEQPRTKGIHGTLVPLTSGALSLLETRAWD
jgi:hypothetical protein